MKKTLLLILNPFAGQKRAKRALGDLVGLFQQFGYEVLVHLTQAPGDGTTAARELGKQVDLVVCSGGDGTLNEVVRGLLESGADTPLGYLPAGSTNDFAYSTGLSSDLMQAARDVMEGTPTRIDVGSFNGRRFAYVAATGAFTEVSYRTPQAAKNLLGRLAFVMEGYRELQDLRALHLTVDCGAGEVLQGEYIFGAVSNVPPMSGLFPPQGGSSLSDGQFEVMLLRFPDTPPQWTQLIAALRQGKDCPWILKRQTSQVHITSPEPISWSLDGEHADAQTDFLIQNLPQALSFVMPPPREKNPRALL